MPDLERLIDLDRQMLLTLNGSDSLFLDGLATALTTASTWVPLYLVLFYIVIRNNENMRQIMLIVACCGICLLLTSGVTDGIVKPLLARFRPTHDPQIALLVDTVNGYRGGSYGFFSAHAANTFGVALFFSLLVRSLRLSAALITWSLINCWTRVYLGVHFPGDILCGLLWGTFAAMLAYLVYHFIYKRITPPARYISTKYTSSGYLRSDVDLVLLVLYVLYFYALVRACFILIDS